MQKTQTIFNLGFWKSGTHSLNHALTVLGYKSVHHITEDGVVLNQLVAENLKNNRRLFEGLDNTYNAFCDFDGFQYYKLLDHQYPTAKFILMLRNDEDWLASIETHKKHFTFNHELKHIQTDWLEFKYSHLQEIQDYFCNKDNILYLDLDQDDCWHQLSVFLNTTKPTEPFPHYFKSSEHLLDKNV